MQLAKISDLTKYELDRLRSNYDIRERIANHWPLVDPRTFEYVLKFENECYSFEEVKSFLGL